MNKNSWVMAMNVFFNVAAMISKMKIGLESLEQIQLLSQVGTCTFQTLFDQWFLCKRCLQMLLTLDKQAMTTSHKICKDEEKWSNINTFEATDIRWFALDRVFVTLVSCFAIWTHTYILVETVTLTQLVGRTRYTTTHMGVTVICKWCWKIKE